MGRARRAVLSAGEGRERVPRGRRPGRAARAAPRDRRLRRPVPPHPRPEDQRAAARAPRGARRPRAGAARGGRLVLRQRGHLQRHAARARGAPRTPEGAAHRAERRRARRHRESGLPDADRGRAPPRGQPRAGRAPHGPPRPRLRVAMTEDRGRAASVGVMALAHLTNDSYAYMLPALLPLLLGKLGIGLGLAGLLVTLYQASSSFTQPIFGHMSDSGGRTRWMAW